MLMRSKESITHSVSRHYVTDVFYLDGVEARLQASFDLVLKIEFFHNSESCCPVGKQHEGKRRRKSNVLTQYLKHLFG